MSQKEIIRTPDLRLTCNDGKYTLKKSGCYPYTLKIGSSTYLAVSILDARCAAQERRYEAANSLIQKLSARLERIESSRVFKFLDWLGLV